MPADTIYPKPQQEQDRVKPSPGNPIHYVVWESLPGGMESFVTYYTERFGKEHEVFIYSLRPSVNGLNASLNDGHFAFGSMNNWACYWGFFRYARRYRRDLFHLLNSGPVILLLALIAGVRTPVYHIHGTRYWKSFLNKLILKASWKLVSFFKVEYIANSVHSAEVFQSSVLKKSPAVIYNGIDIPRFLAKRRLRTSLQKMAYVGRLDRDKNVDVVIRLFEEIAGTQSNLELHIAGSLGIESQLRQMAAESRFSERIFFHGWISNVPDFFSGVDLFVFPSAHESFGNVVAEALLTGLPTLTSKIPVFDEILGETQGYCLGDPSDYDSFRKNFVNAITDYPSLAKKAYQNADRIAALFDLENHLQQITGVYKKWKEKL